MIVTKRKNALDMISCVELVYYSMPGTHTLKARFVLGSSAKPGLYLGPISKESWSKNVQQKFLELRQLMELELESEVFMGEGPELLLEQPKQL